MSSKKTKKPKGKTLALVDFLQDSSGTVPQMPIRKSTMNWADEVEDHPDSYESRSSKSNVVLPTAPKASCGFDDIIDKIPSNGPFTAYISNLPYDVDESEIDYFFRNMKIASLRLPKDDRPGEGQKLKGYGYVEFEDRDSLLNALIIPDTTIKNRRIRIEIAQEGDNDKRRGGGRMDMNRDRERGRSDQAGDWRSGPRAETSDRDGDRDRRGGGGFNRDRERDDTPSGPWRTNRAPDSDRDRGGFTRSGDSNRDRDRGGFTRSNDSRPFSRDDRSQDFSRNRDDRDRDDRFMSRRYDGDRDQDRNRSSGFSRSDRGREDSDSARSSESRQRPKLVLAPRTKPVEPDQEKSSTAPSIFGNAKPVDTSARERQIEERLAKETEPPPRRDMSKDRRDYRQNRDEEIYRGEERDIERAPETEKRSLERTSSNERESDANGFHEKNQHQIKSDEHEKPRDSIKSDVGEKQPREAEVKKREEKKEKPEKEMPQVKAVNPPNFIASNKFAYLGTEDTSD